MLAFIPENIFFEPLSTYGYVNNITPLFKWTNVNYFNINICEDLNVKRSFKNKVISSIKIIDCYTFKNKTQYLVEVNGYHILCSPVLVSDFLKNCKVKDGVVHGEFIFVRIKNKIHLVRVGSDEYNFVVDIDDLSKLKIINKKDLKPNYVYSTKANKQYIFISRVDTEKWSYNWTKNDTTNKSNFIKFNYNNSVLLYEVGNLTIAQAQSELAAIKDINNSKLYKFHMIKSHRLVKEVGKCKVDSNLVKNLKKSALQQLQQKLQNHSGFSHQVSRLSSWFNLCKYKEGIKPIDLEKYILFA